jgi:hypothetical protein
MNDHYRVYAADGTFEDIEFTDEQQAEVYSSRVAAMAQSSKRTAQTLLDETDMVAIRCSKAGVEFPTEWRSYVTELRNIIRTGTGNIPTKPSYPANT